MNMWNNEKNDLKKLVTRNSNQHSSSYPFASRQRSVASSKLKKAA